MTKFNIEFSDKDKNEIVAAFIIETQDEATAYTWAEKQREAMKSNPKIKDPKKLKVRVSEFKPAPAPAAVEEKPTKPTKADKKSKKPKKDGKTPTGQRIKMPQINV